MADDNLIRHGRNYRKYVYHLVESIGSGSFGRAKVEDLRAALICLIELKEDGDDLFRKMFEEDPDRLTVCNDDWMVRLREDWTWDIFASIDTPSDEVGLLKMMLKDTIRKERDALIFSVERIGLDCSSIREFADDPKAAERLLYRLETRLADQEGYCIPEEDPRPTAVTHVVEMASWDLWQRSTDDRESLEDVLKRTWKPPKWIQGATYHAGTEESLTDATLRAAYKRGRVDARLINPQGNRREYLLSSVCSYWKAHAKRIREQLQFELESEHQTELPDSESNYSNDS